MRKTTLLPALFFLAGAAALVPLATFIQRSEAQRILRESSITRDQVALRITACIDARARLVNSLARHPWTGLTQLRQEWTLRAGTLYELYDSVLALNLVNADWRISIIHPVSGNAAAADFDLHQHPSPSVPAALTQAEAGRELVRSDILQLLQGGSGFALYQRIVAADGATLGFVDGVFRLQELMQTCLGEEPLRDRFALQLSEPDGSVFWQLPESGATLIDGFASAITFDVLGKPWTLHFSPTASWLDSQHDPFDEVWPLLALGLLGALALLLRSLMVKHGRLQQSEHQYRLLVENQSDLVAQVDAGGNFMYVSPSFCRLFGRREGELLGQPFMPLVHEDDRELVTQSLATLRQPPHTCYHEQRARTPAGWRLLAWSNSAVLDGRGNIAAITAVGRDITDMRQLEIRAAHAEKMQALGNLAGGISHDFNNILHVVLANIEFLMLDHPDDAPLQAELASISHTLERAMALVARLASLSRQDPLRKDIIDLNEFVGEVLALLRRTLRPSISLHFQPAARPLHVKVDKSQLEQVLLNLCFNARDAITGNGNIRLTLDEGRPARLSAEGEPAAAAYACLRICDDGSGIPVEVLPHIFEPFFTTKSPGNGTGLGLANCHSIIRQHLGEITAHSQPGEGAEFRLYLPLAEADTDTDTGAAPEPAPPAAAAAPADTVLAPQRGCILVVDDDAEILRLTAALLRNAGFRTLVASNGEEALQLLTRHHDDVVLVLMDVLMPVLGGIEAADRMQEEHPALPVLLMSGYVPDALQSGDRRLLRKPFTRETLLEAVSYSLSSDAT